MINEEGESRGKPIVRIQDVAERAGVSTMTVSLALREGGAKRMSPDTRERVLRIARELNYQPNARARAFRLGRTNVIGLYAGYGYINVRSPFFTEIVSGLQEGCEEMRRDLLLHGVFHGTSPEDIYMELADGRIDGLVVTIPPQGPLATKLVQSGLAVVAVTDAVEGLPSVVADDAGGMLEVVKHLYEKGHRRIEFVLSPAQPVSALRRRDAFWKACADFGIVSSLTVIEANDDVTPLVSGAKERGITAFACWNDIVARLTIDAARQNGLRVPEDIAVVGFDGCPMPITEPFPLTTVAAPWAEAARLAVSLIDAILRGESVAMETVLPVRFVPGATT